jgi:hypothetical protein
MTAAELRRDIHEALCLYAVTAAAGAEIESLITRLEAAVLNEAADALDESETLRDLTDDHMGDVHATTSELRRMADARR